MFIKQIACLTPINGVRVALVLNLKIGASRVIHQ